MGRERGWGRFPPPTTALASRREARGNCFAWVGLGELLCMGVGGVAAHGLGEGTSPIPCPPRPPPSLCPQGPYPPYKAATAEQL
ncbi:hypothetical protein COCOBI_pt-0170 (chloroplast) [Coccomyxa sp. Obi]|nr:hypothetical protein COCOBI_pt-0170 [Coccomyxa sp. Obi]